MRPRHLVLARAPPTRRVHRDRDAHPPKLLLQGCPRRLGLNQHVVRLPMVILLLGNPLEFREVPPPTLHVQQDNRRPCVLVQIEHAPGCDDRVVRRLLLRVRRVHGLNDVVHLRRLVLLPHPPPLPLQNSPLIIRGLLLVHGVPLLRRQGGLDPLQLLNLPEPRPQRPTTGHDCRELDDLPLVRVPCFLGLQ